MAYVPVQFAKGELTETAETPEQYAQLLWDGWTPTGQPDLGDVFDNDMVSRIERLDSGSRAAIIDLVEGEDFVVGGGWEFAQVPTVAGVPIGSGDPLHDHDDRYLTEAEVAAQRTRKYEFAPGSSSGTRVWVRLATLNGVSVDAGAAISFILAGAGDYGDPDRGTVLVHFGQRGSNVTGVRAWGFDVENTSDPIELHTRQISEFVFELWALLSDYNQTHHLHILSSSHPIGSVQVNVNVDSATGVAPTPLVARAITSASAGIRIAMEATAAPTANAVVRRDSAGRAQVVAPSTGADIARLDTVQSYSGLAAINAQAGTAYTVVTADFTREVHLNNSAPITVTLPANATTAIPVGAVVVMNQSNAGQVSVVGATGVIVRAPAGYQARSRRTDSKIFARKAAIDTWVVYGDLELAITGNSGVDPARRDYVETRTPAATEDTAGLVFYADQAEALAADLLDRAMSPLRVAQLVEQMLSNQSPPSKLNDKGVIEQNSDGTWPSRTTVTTDPLRSIDWNSLPGNTAMPVVGGTHGMGVKDFYERRANA